MPSSTRSVWTLCDLCVPIIISSGRGAMEGLSNRNFGQKKKLGSLVGSSVPLSERMHRGN